MRWTLFIILALTILLAGYTVWPFYGLYRIASAVETRNSAALQELVDIPSLRGSMARQVADAHLKLTGKSADTSEGTRSMGSRVGAMVADALLAKIILNPERLLDLLGKGLVSAESIAAVRSFGSLCGEQFGQRMADLAQLGLQRRKLLCSRSC